MVWKDCDICDSAELPHSGNVPAVSRRRRLYDHTLPNPRRLRSHHLWILPCRDGCQSHCNGLSWQTELHGRGVEHSGSLHYSSRVGLCGAFFLYFVLLCCKHGIFINPTPNANLNTHATYPLAHCSYSIILRFACLGVCLPLSSLLLLASIWPPEYKLLIFFKETWMLISHWSIIYLHFQNVRHNNLPMANHKVSLQLLLLLHVLTASACPVPTILSFYSQLFSPFCRPLWLIVFCIVAFLPLMYFYLIPYFYVSHREHTNFSWSLQFFMLLLMSVVNVTTFLRIFTTVANTKLADGWHLILVRDYLFII